MVSKLEILRCRAYEWLREADYIRSAVLFGSSARQSCGGTSTTASFADIDFHVIVRRPRCLRDLNWSHAMPKSDFCMAVWRPASGGVKKCTAVFSSGQIDLVVVPELLMYMVRVGMILGLHRRDGRLRAALNEMAVCLHGGYRFVRGERSWGKVYSAVAGLPGPRLSDEEIEVRANAALADILWVLQKLESGEVVAAQFVLHSRIVDATLRLLRELRLRESLPLPSFGLGRKLELILEQEQYRSICVNSLANARDLECATRELLSGMCAIVKRLLPNWSVGLPMKVLLTSHGPSSHQP